MGMKNAANHTPTPDFTAWLVTTVANIFGDIDDGSLIKEFRTEQQARKFAATTGGEVSTAARDASDWKINSTQEGTRDNGTSVRGRWTGRYFNRKFGNTYTYVELKIDGVCEWVNP